MQQRTEAIVTHWNDIEFRSRTEARWAVFFDELNIQYEYEQLLVTLSSGDKYLPDFYLPQFNAYLEIKPDSDAIVTQECFKAQCLAIDLRETEPETSVWLATGAPDSNQARIIPLSQRLDLMGRTEGIVAQTEIENSLSDEYGRYFLLEDRRDDGIFWLVAGNYNSNEIPHAFSVGGWGIPTDHDRYPIMTKAITRAYQKSAARWDSIAQQ